MSQVKEKIFHDSPPEKAMRVKRSKKNDHKWIMYDQPIVRKVCSHNIEYVSIVFNIKALSN
jgi:hypothetical protein